MNYWNKCQDRTVRDILGFYAAGKRRVLTVGPTGSGKTRVATMVSGGFRGRMLWCVHRQELVSQSVQELRRTVNPGTVGFRYGGRTQNPTARIQVATAQTLIRRELPPADLIVLDEAHHYEADEWRKIHEAYPQAMVLGLTATPERADGSRLGDIFDELVVVAHYSELISHGVLVPYTVLQPPEFLGRDLAEDPLSAWMTWAGGNKTFAFYHQVTEALTQASRFRRRGIKSDTIYADTSKPVRRGRIDAFRGAHLTVIHNVDVLTEGVNIPDAQVILLARQYRNRANYVQSCGRAARCADGKKRALLIDLCGSSHLHGSPVDDWDYKLEGRGKKEAGEPRECAERSAPEAGQVVGSGLKVADFCADKGVTPDTLWRLSEQEVGSEESDIAIAELAKRKGVTTAERARHLFQSLE